MRIILTPSDVAIIWEKMQGEQEQGTDNEAEAFKKSRAIADPAFSIITKNIYYHCGDGPPTMALPDFMPTFFYANKALAANSKNWPQFREAISLASNVFIPA